MKKPTLQLALLGLLLIWAFASQLPFSWRALYLQSHASGYVQVPYMRENFGTRIDAVLAPYQTTGLRVGDQIIALNDLPLNGDEQESKLWFEAKPGQLLTVTVDRVLNGHNQPLRFTFALRPNLRDTSDWPLVLILRIILPICCLLVGFYIAFARPNDPLAWIAMAMLASFSEFAGSTSVLLASPWREFLFFYDAILGNTWPLWMLLFALYFPVPFPFIKRMPWIGWLLAILPVGHALLELYGNFLRLQHLHQLAWLAQLDKAIKPPVVILYTAYVFAFFTALNFKAHMPDLQPDARRRLRLMIVGCSLALTPTLPVVFGEIHLFPRLPAWLVTVCLSALILFPITMAYIIVVQRAMDVRMVVRSGVQYAFASTGIKVVQILILIAVTGATIHLAEQTNRRLEEIVIGAIGVGLVFSVRRLTEWVKAWMDRRFFREAYNAELILTDLSSSVAGIRDIKVLLETVTKRISESLHIPRITVFLEREGVFRAAYALGSLPPLETVAFQPQTGVVNFLRRQQSPSKVYFSDPQNWIHGAPESEQAVLQNLDTQVLLPLSLKSRLMGIISLGAKRSEEPYSRADLQLLGAVASQTGLALENAELSESVRREIAQRERLNRELEIAREVQQRLFPQKLPIVSNLDFAGYCRPAEGVGGDYYDFIHLPDHSLGIAVGDVSGKGIAAALMMASLQASLRGQTIKPCETLSEMIQHINRLVYEASAENRYATFFYAQYEPSTRVVRYVNAGHNPPLVWRQTGGRHEFMRLEDGGTVVGLFPEFPFCEGRVQLMKGDVVVAFTDGISEAMNSLDEEYGEDRLTEALCLMQARSAADMITHILTQVDGFTAGAKQHDDMTLVVIRVQ